MKIGILTLPLHSNYGGIIQAYALKRVLEKLGHEIFFFEHIAYPQRPHMKFRNLIYFKRFILKYFFRQNIIVRYDRYCQLFNAQKLKQTLPFIEMYIQKNYYTIDNINSYLIDAFIVGSDQVWRTNYAKPIQKYFLNFIKDKKDIKKIAYAASFGTDKWEFSPQQTEECARLAKKFDLITVREDSGVNLCKQYLGVSAEQVLDPTMLLGIEDYVKIIKAENTLKSKGNLFAYILNNTSQKQEFIKNMAIKKELKAFSIIPEEAQNIIAQPYPGIHIWLRAFMDAEFIVTDSFHGCVFSIIFNKPFIAIGNKERGQARFDSLLKLFDLENRLIDLSQLNAEPVTQDIDWNKVNSIRQMLREKSISLINRTLT